MFVSRYCKWLVKTFDYFYKETLSINFAKFYIAEKNNLLTHNSRGVILLRFRRRFCIVGSLCPLRKSFHLSHTVYCPEANFKSGNVRPRAIGRVLSKPGLCIARPEGGLIRWARTCSGVFLVIFINCRKTEDYLTVHKACWVNALNQQKETEAVLCFVPVVFMDECWVCQDYLCFCVTRWPCAGKGYRVALGACLSQHNVQHGVLPPVQDWLVFLVGFWSRKSNPCHQWTMGWVQRGCCIQHVTTRPAQFSGGQHWVQRSSFLFSCAWCWHSVS